MIRRDVREDLEWRRAQPPRHGPAELVPIELGDRSGQERIARRSLHGVVGVTGEVEPGGSGGAKNEVGPVERALAGEQRIGEARQRFALLLVHRENIHVLGDECAPEVRPLRDDEPRA